MQDDAKTVVIRYYDDELSAGLAQSMLAEWGIESFLSNDTPHFTNLSHFEYIGFAIKLYVDERNVKAANEVLKDELNVENSTKEDVYMCPYCNSDKIIKVKTQSEFYDSMNNIFNAYFRQNTQIYRKEIYICTSCSKKFKLEDANWE